MITNNDFSIKSKKDYLRKKIEEYYSRGDLITCCCESHKTLREFGSLSLYIKLPGEDGRNLDSWYEITPVDFIAIVRREDVIPVGISLEKIINYDYTHGYHPIALKKAYSQFNNK